MHQNLLKAILADFHLKLQWDLIIWPLTELHRFGQNPVHAKFLLMEIHWRTDTQKETGIFYTKYHFPYTILHLSLFLPNETAPLYRSSAVVSSPGKSQPLFNVNSLLKFQAFTWGSVKQFGHLTVGVFLMEQDMPQEKWKSKPAAPRSAMPKTMHRSLLPVQTVSRETALSVYGLSKTSSLQDLHSYSQEIGHYL